MSPRLAANTHAVFLVNFLSPNLLPVFREVQKLVGKLTILVSVPIESNRNWEVDFGDLDVIVQRTWTKTQKVQHPAGYDEELYVHIPLDTFKQLRSLNPDCVVSLEMGTRSLLSSCYRMWNRKTRHVVSVYGSERSEAGRGKLRRFLRQWLLKRADVVTYNGPSCLRYLQALGANEQKMLPWNYASDPAKSYSGPILAIARPPLSLLTVSQFIERKGVVLAAETLSKYATRFADRQITWTLVGTGPQEVKLREVDYPSNLQVTFAGHCNAQQLQEFYASHECLLFPTLGDEWGLVVDEALASGQIVLGSIHSQAVEALIVDGINGWQFDPEVPESLHQALDSVWNLDHNKALSMRIAARTATADRSPRHAAEQFVEAVNAALNQT